MTVIEVVTEKVFDVLPDDSRMTETQIAIASGLSLTETTTALDYLIVAGRVRREVVDGLAEWSRTDWSVER
jgi:hypothetical protein